MRSEVDLIKEMFGEMSCLISLRFRAEASLVCCESLLFHGYMRPSSSSKTWMISWCIS